MPTDNQGGKPASPGQGGLSWTQPSGSNTPPRTQPTQEKKVAPPQQKLLSLKELPRSAPLAAAVGSGNSSKTVLIASFVAGVVLGLFAGWIWFEKNPEPAKKTDSTASVNIPNVSGVSGVAPVSQKEVGVTDIESTLTLAPTQEAGLTVSIGQVNVVSPSWVVVYENKEGSPGNALGAALFDAERTGGTVYLLRETTAGQTYLVGLRRDDGDHVFSLEKDVSVQDKDGKPLLMQFQAQ